MGEPFFCIDLHTGEFHVQAFVVLSVNKEICTVVLCRACVIYLTYAKV